MGHHFSSKFNSNFEKFTASAINLTKKCLKFLSIFIKDKFVLKATRVAHVESNGALVFHSKMNCVLFSLIFYIYGL